MLPLRDKIHSPAEALLKLTLMRRAPARSGAARPKKVQTQKQEGLLRKSLGSARASSQKQQKKRRDMQRLAAPDARERIPTGAGGAARSYYLYSAYQRFNSNQKLRPSCRSSFRTLLGQE